MNRHNLVVFELLNLQYTWGAWKKWESLLSNLAKGLVVGLRFGLVAGLSFGLFNILAGDPIFGLVIGLSFGLLVGLLDGLSGFANSNIPSIETIENIQWSFKFLLQSLEKRLLHGLAAGLVIGLIFGMFVGLTQGSFTGGFLVGLPLGMFVFVSGVLGDFSTAEYFSYLQLRSPYQRFKASAKALYVSILQHWLLCYQLYRKGLLPRPRNLVSFLNEMVERKILETDGATWRSRHRILQDYFAGLWKEEE